MNRSITLLLAALLASFAGCATYQPLTFMRGSDIAAADKAPDATSYAERSPGTGAQILIERTISGQPPLIPHTVAKYEPITIEENACLDCHISDEFKGQKMPRIGDSHFSKTAKEADGSPAVSMLRWQCESCHVPQTDAVPLVENNFVGTVK